MDQQLLQLVSELVRMNHELIHEIRDDRKQITNKLDLIMSKISDFAVALNAFFDKQDTAITDLVADVKNLNDQITALQNSSGAITPEDQALLDGLQTRASGIADKLDALDAQTPPVPPAP
jgi:predicted  nucleic acid-binding Zn-ribbon protein